MSKRERVLLVDGLYGTHVPERFAERFAERFHVNPDDALLLRLGPSGCGDQVARDQYWEAWDEVLANGRDDDGYTLYQSPEGDVFGVRENDHE